MINTILRKTLYKNYDFRMQHMILQLLGHVHIFIFFCNLFWLVFLLLPIVLLPIVFPIMLLNLPKQLLFLLFLFLYVMGIVYIFRTNGFFEENFLYKFLHFFVFTQKGNAISKNDFKNIKKNDKYLYRILKNRTCLGKCYTTCFQLLKILQKGSMLFISIKELTLKNETPYNTIHVLFINENWAFDTYSQRQFPIEKIFAIYQPQVYTTFSFDDVKNYTYEEFRSIHYEDFAKWCKENDTFQFWNCN